MKEEDAKSIIIDRFLEINLKENENQYTTRFHKIDHLITDVSILHFSVENFTDYINDVFSPSLELNRPTFFNIIEESQGEIYIYTVLCIVMSEFVDNQSICVSDGNKRLLHLVTLDEFHRPNN